MTEQPEQPAPPIDPSLQVAVIEAMYAFYEAYHQSVSIDRAAFVRAYPEAIRPTLEQWIDAFLLEQATVTARWKELIAAVNTWEQQHPT